MLREQPASCSRAGDTCLEVGETHIVSYPVRTPERTLTVTTAAVHAGREALVEEYRATQRASIAMCESLEPEAFRIQPMDDVSPPWWNLGHTSWFFARNILEPFGGEYTPDDRELDYLLNSYYVSLGARLARNRRGFVTRPTTAEIYRYRASVDARVERLLERIDQSRWAELEAVLRIGINHEQQHQEFFYTEIKYILFQNPAELREAYRPAADAGCTQVPPSGGRSRDLEGETQNISGGLLEFGHRDGGWCWDNELPVHKQYLNDFALRRRLVTCGEYLEFIDDGGYRQPLLWLDNGWRR